MSGPPHNARRSIPAFPSFALLAFERRDPTVREADRLSAVVSGKHDDRVVQLTHLFQLRQNNTDVIVELLHTGFVYAPVLSARLSDHSLILRRQYRGHVHARG